MVQKGALEEQDVEKANNDSSDGEISMSILNLKRKRLGFWRGESQVVCIDGQVPLITYVVYRVVTLMVTSLGLVPLFLSGGGLLFCSLQG